MSATAASGATSGSSGFTTGAGEPGEAVSQAEERLEHAKAARAALDEKPVRPERHLTTTWQSFEDYRRDRPLGATLNS